MPTGISCKGMQLPILISFFDPLSILSPTLGDKEIEIYTLTGRKVLQTTISNSTLNIESLTAGFYMIKVTIDNKSKTSKLVVR